MLFGSITRRGVLGLALVMGCAASASHAGAEDTVTIGSFVSTSGPGAAYGLDQLQAIQLAIKQINAAGGIGGRKIVLDQQDTAFNKTEAQSVMRGFVGNKSIIGIVGPTSSAEAFAADPMAVAAGLPVLAPNNGAQGVPQIGPYVHRIGVPEELLLPGAASYAAKKLKLKSAAIMYAQNDPFATTGYKAFESSLKADGVDVVEVIGYDSSTVDFTAQLQRIKDKKPDAVFVAALATDAAVLLRQMRQAGITSPVVGNLAFTSPALVKAAGDAVEGLVVAATWDPTNPSEMNQTFIKEYKAAYNRDPTPLSVPAYNCVYIIKEALEKSKDFTREGLQKGLLQMNGFHYLGVEIDFKDIVGGLRDAAVKIPVLFQHKDGQLVKLSD